MSVDRSGQTNEPDTAEPVVFDPFSTMYFDDPYPVYARLRTEAPVYRNDTYGFYALSRYADVCAASKDWGTFTSTHGVDLSTLSKPEMTGIESIIMLDPPKHDRLRALVSRVFTPRAVAALEPMVRDVIRSYLDPLDGEPSFDILADAFAPFPVEIIARMLGVPEGERQQIRHALDLALHREPGEMHPSPAGIEAMIGIGVFYYGLIADKRVNPGDDMLTRLTEVEVELDDGTRTRLDDVEIAGFAALLGGAGAETVTKLLGNAVVLFADHPDEWRRILDDPTLIPKAVEEVLRIHPPSQYQGRFSTIDSEWAGVTIPAGHPVILLTGAANRDPDAFDEPDAFRIDRPPSLSLGFGYGIHSCLGAALARLESRIAIEELARRWPRFTVDRDGLRRVHMSNVAGYSHVPISVS